MNRQEFKKLFTDENEVDETRNNIFKAVNVNDSLYHPNIESFIVAYEKCIKEEDHRILICNNPVALRVGFIDVEVDENNMEKHSTWHTASFTDL